jgi:hypothetical protein
MANLTLMRIYQSQGGERWPVTDNVGTSDGGVYHRRTSELVSGTRHEGSVVELGVLSPILVPALSSRTETVSGGWSDGTCIISRASTDEWSRD